ncbi:hypothetical protein AXG93_2774s1000 [Marchantia polymorpha subsp. ruderalis]|uniref:Uncharacterized protein n=1 Tax=Marchantia polymorpha subsp. ruderalis TaxID=1480154 RepID=A0A176VG01_MARPO|nr:hypothetical protein AXG93_2774s1000 [Marchantia polymorpha subsp. ruderalis]
MASAPRSEIKDAMDSQSEPEVDEEAQKDKVMPERSAEPDNACCKRAAQHTSNVTSRSGKKPVGVQEYGSAGNPVFL